MKKFDSLFSVALLLCLVWACGGKKAGEKPEGASKVVAAVDTVVQVQATVLPPLDGGEVFLKNEDVFGEDIVLNGTHTL